MDETEIQRAVEALRAGALIALPTETVYGLGADASNPEAVRQVFAVKGRPSGHPLIVHLASAEAMDTWAREVPPAARALAAQFWPGPLTLVLHKAPHVPSEVTGGQDTVALRVPAHPVARAVLEAFGGGIAAPSANRYGRISPTTADAVREDLGDAVAVVLDGGPCEVGLESTIVSCLDDTVSVLRPGRVTHEDIERCVGPLEPRPGHVPRVPGSTRSHYAPLTPLTLVGSEDLTETVRQFEDEGLTVGVLALRARPSALRPRMWVVARQAPDAYGQDLYAQLRALDKVGADRLVVERPAEGPLWTAVHDRLRRAAATDEEDEPAEAPDASAP